jgi:hypothetical protein
MDVPPIPTWQHGQEHRTFEVRAARIGNKDIQGHLAAQAIVVVPNASVHDHLAVGHIFDALAQQCKLANHLNTLRQA